MMTSLLWVAVLACMTLGFLATIVPILPGIPLLWVAFLLYHYGINSTALSTSFWIAAAFVTVAIFAADFAANSLFVRRFGGSKAAVWAAIAGTLVGPLLLGPLGLLVGPFLLALAAELVRGRNLREALTVGLATLLGFLGGAVAKAILKLVIIAWFWIDVLW
ncbi:DUF456 domain-containing protein [Calditerricola yamamurae]